MTKKAWLICVALSAWCSVAFAQRTSDLADALERQKVDRANCLESLARDTRVKLLELKLPLDGSLSPSIELLGNRQKPTAKEKAAISYMVSELERCVELDRDWRKENVMPEFIELADEYMREAKFILADLYGGKITYGDTAKLRAKVHSDWRSKADAVIAALKERQELAVRRQREAAEKDRLAVERLLAEMAEKREAASQRAQLEQQQLEHQRMQMQILRQQAETNQRQNQFNEGLRLLQLAAPKPPAPMFNNSINCRTTYFGNQAQTRCD